jgi:hypothetical protein
MWRLAITTAPKEHKTIIVARGKDFVHPVSDLLENCMNGA